MTNSIEHIMRELLEIDPSFKTHEKELRHLIQELLSKKPDTQLDENFVMKLRERLLEQKPIPSPFMKYAFMPYVLAVLALLVTVPLGYQFATNGTQPSKTALFAMSQQIDHVKNNAYGALQPQEGGQGGPGEGISATMAADTPAPTEAVAAQQANSAVSAAGKGGGFADSRMMVPEGPITVYRYVYKGDALELQSEGKVYSREKNSVSSGQIAAQLKNFNFGLVDLGGFADMRVRSFELAEDKIYGYSITASFDEGMISINPNYTKWPGLNGKEAGTPLPQSAMMNEEELISMAKKFLDEHDISLDNFGDPVVQDYGQYTIAMDAAASSMPAPEQVTVTFPLKIEGTEVLEDGAYPYGLQVGISVREKRVMSVYGLTSQTYSSSNYALEAGSDKILAVLGKGGPHAWTPQESDGVKIKKIEVEVGTPKKVLMHTYNYANGESRELFVPALSFPVTKPPANEQYYPKEIVIPLVPDLLNDPGGPVMYDMVR